MPSVTDLPTEYKPFNLLELCSNRLIGVMVPISVEKRPVLLVGRDSVPLVWLSVVTKSGGLVQEVAIVRASKSANKGVGVNVDASAKSVSVKVNELLILHVVQTSEDSAAIDQIDLRPLGLNIHGTKTDLKAGGAILQTNTFQNVHTALAFGD